MTQASPRLPSATPRLDGGPTRLASGLGWFSVGLGLTELLAPRAITSPLGLHGHEGLVRTFGARGIGTGIGLLGAPNPAFWLPFWLWGRVAGDALDMATLTASLGNDNHRRPKILVALATLAGVTALDAYCASHASRKAAGTPDQRAEPEIERSITVGGSAADLLHLLQEPATLPQIVAHFADVQPADESRTRWTLHRSLGRSVSWTLRAVADESRHGLRWEAEPGQSAFLSRASVHLRPGPRGRGTVVTLRARFNPHLGMRGPDQPLTELVLDALLDKTLDFLKSLAETGEVPSTKRQPAARSNPY
jgi:uncharacterized membrane protein